MTVLGRDASGNLLSPDSGRIVSARTWAVASLVILVLVAMAAIATARRSPNSRGTLAASDAYAVHLPIRDIALSEATNGAGGKSTYVDGTIANTGNRTLTAAVVQVTFATGSGPYRETLPLSLVRTRQPYVDLQSVVAAPILPGTSREFRLIFETVPQSWDVHPPTIKIVHAEVR